MSVQKKSNRRQFIGNLGVLSLGFPIAARAHGNTFLSLEDGEHEHGFSIFPYLESLTPTSCCITMMTKSKSLTWLEYGEKEPSQIAFQVEHGLRQANTTLFKIPLTNLKPETTYVYRFASKSILEFNPKSMTFDEEQRTEIYTFTTPSSQPEECRVIVFNDLHNTAQDHLDSFVRHISGKPVDFCAFNGDILSHIEDEEQVLKHFFHPVGKLFSTHTPVIYLRGNHEARGKYAREFLDYFDKPNGKTYQAFRRGPVHWTFLDTGEDKEDTDIEYSGMVDFDQLRLEQRDWLEKVVETEAFKSAPFRVVIMHIPPIFSDNAHGTTHCKELFVPIFNAHNVDAVITGHRHIHALHRPSELNKFALFIGGGPRKGQDTTLIDIKADQKQLMIRTILNTGEELYRWEKST